MGRWLLIGALMMSGCGDDPCASCPAGTHRCVPAVSPPGTPLLSTKTYWECLEVLKVIEK